MISDPLDKAQWSGKKIGLLGGSFNPAHEGHLAISDEAIKRLNLDAVWWLVSPQNPLKGSANLASFDKRIKKASTIASHPHIKIMDFEKRQGLSYTIDTLEWLDTHFPETKFVWLMGADCLIEFDKWKSWEKIIEIVPFAVFARPGYSIDNLPRQVAARWEGNRLPDNKASRLADAEPPAWAYIEGPLVNVSATGLRRQGKAKQNANKEKGPSFGRK